MPSHRGVISTAIVVCGSTALWAIGAGHEVLALVVGGRAAALGYYLRGLRQAAPPLDALLPPLDNGIASRLLSLGTSLLTVVLPLALLVALPRLVLRYRARKCRLCPGA